MTEVKSLYDIGFEHGYAKAKEGAEPKQGHWIKTGNERSGAPESIRCSVCGFWYYKLMPRNYCSNCGAKMNEVEE